MADGRARRRQPDRRARAAGRLPGRVGAAQRHRLRAEGRHRDRGRRRGARGAEPRRRAGGVRAVRRLPRQRRRQPASSQRSRLRRTLPQAPRAGCRSHYGSMRSASQNRLRCWPPACALAVVGAAARAIRPRASSATSTRRATPRRWPALQTGLVTVGAACRRTPPAATAADLAAALQAKDPTNRYTTAPPTDAGIIQVLGRRRRARDAGRDQLAPSAGREPYYLAAWQGAGARCTTSGTSRPRTRQRPAGAGWSATLPQ